MLFDYRKTRGCEGSVELLETFSGYLQTDGYTAYTNLKNKSITLLACMAHARRKVEHALENDRPRAEFALLKIQQLYQIEANIREQLLSTDAIKALRHEKALPVFLEMETWLKEEIYKVLPKSAIGTAFAYTLNLWPRLVRYVEDGRFLIDNNLIENSIRPFALGEEELSICWLSRSCPTGCHSALTIRKLQNKQLRAFCLVETNSVYHSRLSRQSTPHTFAAAKIA